MDRIDRKIIAQLQRDASIANSELADRVGLAPSSCLRRVRRLKDEGVIQRIVAITDGSRLGRGLKAVVTVEFSDHAASIRDDWADSLLDEPEVTQVYFVSGRTDAVVVLSFGRMEEFPDLSRRLFAERPEIQKFETMFVLKQHKFEPGH